MQPDGKEFARLMIAALRGGSGKTILSIGLIAALIKSGNAVSPFKKGPDYIDAGWLALAAGRPCYNLDSFLLSRADNLQSFLNHSIDCDISVIEGNRGLHDGIDLEGSTSTAELAKLLQCPVLLCVDCTKITRTMAAVVMGCSQFDPEVRIRAVILNRVANARHEKKLRESIEHYCDIPVLGAIPKLSQQHFPERHLGLVPTPEHDWAKDSIEAVTLIAEQYIDLKAIVNIARQAPGIMTEDGKQKTEDPSSLDERRRGTQNKLEVGTGVADIDVLQPTSSDRYPVFIIEKPIVRIGVIKDSAFQFYYPENIEALSQSGAEVVFVSPLEDKNLPPLEALYIGGGFPETHAEQLAANKKFSQKLKNLVQVGFPVYAECGGLMYLGEKLLIDGRSYSMAGILPVTFDFYKRPQGHGYTIVKVEGKNPYYNVGVEIKGHEFHYSRVVKWAGAQSDLVFRMKRGAGISKDRDGIVYKNVLATYTHVHALGTPGWAEALVRNAIEFQKFRR
jgi:cobyrinic acid a,c-diamide synthase